MNNDKQARKAKETESYQQNARPLQRETIENFWKTYSERQLEIMQSGEIMIKEILKIKA